MRPACARGAQHHFSAGDLDRHEPRFIENGLVELNRIAGVSYAAATSHDLSHDARKDDAILEAAIRANIEAVQATARSVRMGLTTGSAGIVDGDLHKLVHHVEELAAELRGDMMPRAGAKTHDRAQLRQAIGEVHTLEQEIAARPALASQLAQDSAFRFALATLEDMAATKAGSWTHREQVHDIKARVIRRQIHDDAVEIVIGSGANQGILDGMKGYLTDDQGHRDAGFTVHDVTHDTCKASIETTSDNVRWHPFVVINPARP